MALLSVNQMTTFRWSFEEDVHHYAAAGLAGIGIWRQKLADYGEEKGAELLTETGLAVSSLHWVGGFTGSEGASYKESIEEATEAIRLAGLLKAGCVIAYSGARAGHTSNHARRLVKNALAELAPVAAEQGTVLALEPMHPGCATECTFLTSLDAALDVIEAVDSPSVKLAFDTYHLCQDGLPSGRLAEAAACLALVQLGDSRQPPEGEQNRCHLGQGTLPLAEVVAALREGGYDGYYEVDLLGEEIEEAEYGDTLQRSKDFCAELIGA